MTSALRVGALAIALGMVVLGIKGVVAPADFVAMVTSLQVPPKIYLAAAIRVVVGLVLFFAAPASRMPRTLRIIGIVITIGGLTTPFIGTWLAHVILDAWSSGGADVVRAWGAGAVGLGAFLGYANFPRRPAATP